MLTSCADLSPAESPVSIALDLLDSYEFNVRWPAIRFVTQLLRVKVTQVQQIILEKPRAISNLIDIMQDPREVIRNEGILALLELTRSSPAIQKIVVFENTFELLLQIIEQEGHSDGDVVVADCLNLMLQLLADNASNIGFFRENTFIPRISPFFDIQHTESFQIKLK